MDEDVGKKWEFWKLTLLGKSKNILKRKGVVNRKRSMTDKILELMEEKTSYKHRAEIIYNSINAEIRRRIRRAKEECYAGKCTEIEELNSKN